MAAGRTGANVRFRRRRDPEHRAAGDVRERFVRARSRRTSVDRPAGRRQPVGGRSALELDGRPTRRRTGLPDRTVHEGHDGRGPRHRGSVGEGIGAGGGLPGHRHRSTALDFTGGVHHLWLSPKLESGGPRRLVQPVHRSVVPGARHPDTFPRFLRTREDPGRSDRPHLPAGHRAPHRDLGSGGRSPFVGVRHGRPWPVGHGGPRRDSCLQPSCQRSDGRKKHSAPATLQHTARRAVPCVAGGGEPEVVR